MVESTPKPLVPCGSYAAFKRHKRNGEDPCDECQAAARDHWRARGKRDYARPEVRAKKLAYAAEKAQARRVAPRSFPDSTCLTCESVFTPKQPTQVYCGPRCRGARRASRPKPRWVERPAMTESGMVMVHAHTNPIGGLMIRCHLCGGGMGWRRPESAEAWCPFCDVTVWVGEVPWPARTSSPSLPKATGEPLLRRPATL